MSLTRPVYKSSVRGRGSGQPPLARGQVHGSMSSVERQDSHSRNHEPYYGSSSSGHVGTPQQHGSYSSYDSQNMNWRVHNGPRNYPPTRSSQTPPTPESPSQPSLVDDEAVRFLADAWAEVEREQKDPNFHEASRPVLYEDKTPYRNRQEYEQFDLDSWHTRRLSRH